MTTSAIDKIRKLLALAGDKGATEHEASLAAAKAAEIMEEYGITTATIEAQGGSGEQRLKDTSSSVGLAREKWAETLMSSIAESCFVTSYTQRDSLGRLDKFNIYGRQSAVASAQVMYDYLSRTVIRLSRKEQESQRHFRFGAAERIAARLSDRRRRHLDEQRKASNTASPQGTSNALVIVLEDYELKERDLNEDFRRGKPPGTTLAERTARQAKYAAQDARQTQLIASGVGSKIAWLMAYMDMNEEQARGHLAARAAQAEQPDTSSRRYRYRVDFDERRRYSSSYQRGSQAGAAVGLDPQLASNKRRLT